MRDLELQERFELEVLDRLNSKKLLNELIFTGGTMLRLCYGLNRFSVDLDFWITDKTDASLLSKSIRLCLEPSYKIVDTANKFYTILYEIRSKEYPRSLKIEIRKEKKQFGRESSIAYSIYSNTQVLLKTIPLGGMMQAKIEALIDRKEIRDAFDIEFLIKKGIKPIVPPDVAGQIIAIVNNFSKNDYSVKLGSLLAAPDRKYYSQENFKILKNALKPS